MRICFLNIAVFLDVTDCSLINV